MIDWELIGKQFFFLHIYVICLSCVSYENVKEMLTLT